MKINEVEKLLDIPKATIRYYEDEGLLKPSRTDSGYREYSDSDVDRLKTIIVLRKVGVAIPDISTLLKNEVELTDVLNKTMSNLKQQHSELESAIQVCGEILKENDNIADFDSEKYYAKIRSMERAGSKFVSLTKEYMDYEAESLRKRGYLPKSPTAPTHKKAFTFICKFLLIAMLPPIVINVGVGEPVKATILATVKYASIFMLLALALSLIFFAVLKIKGPAAEEKARKNMKKIAVAGLLLLIPATLFLTGVAMGMFARPKIYDDIAIYDQLKATANADDVFYKYGMDESIWPDKITENMQVADYKMVRLDSWDVNFLGYLVVKYDDAGYKTEIERLNNYNSTEYKGYYGVTGEEDYELLAINADPYYGFIYAMTDNDNTIIYAEQLFANGFMDLKYEKYMPKEYFLDGFNATENNSYGKKFIEEMPDVYFIQGNPAE